MPYAPLELTRMKDWWSHHSVARSALSIKYLSECGSTNAQLYRSPSQHHTLLVAETQIQGRGQFERVWRSQSGDLIFSLGLRLPIDKIPALSIRVGLALAQTLNAYGCHIQLKWPNDVIGDTGTHKGKLAGILVQTNPSEHSATRWVVIGVGLNVASRLHESMDDTTPSAFPPIGLAQLDSAWQIQHLPTGARETLLMRLVDAILLQIEAAHTLPDPQLTQHWNAYDVWQQQSVQWSENGTVDTAMNLPYGAAQGINEWGAYRIRSAADNAIITLNSGQIRAYHPIDLINPIDEPTP